MTRNFEDGLNLNGTRNFLNTPRDLYNCGGYAFETFSWLWPGINQHRQSYIDGAMWDGHYETALRLSVEDLLTQFPEYKIVPCSYELKHNYPAKKYVIVAFRLNRFDFHFWKLGRNGKWYEKRGCRPEIHTHNFNEVWEPWRMADGNYYDSEVVFFVKKR